MLPRMAAIDACRMCGRSRYEPHQDHAFVPASSPYDPIGSAEPDVVIAQGMAMSRGAGIGILSLVMALVACWITAAGASELGARWVAYLVIAMMIACSVWLVVLARNLRQPVFVRTSELLERRRDGTETSIRWDEPHDLFVHDVQVWIGPVPTPSQMTATVTTSDGRRIAVHSNARVNREAVAAIQAQSARGNFVQIAMRLRAGETVPFGPISLCGGEIAIGKKRGAIHDIVDMRIVDGFLKLKLDGALFASKIALRKIANYDCLLRIIDPPRR